MPNTVLVGAQWGDEGKGKITDLIASKYDYVVRYQGGNNAGHTVIHGDKKLALHLMPSGVMYENAVPVIGNGDIASARDALARLDTEELHALLGPELSLAEPELVLWIRDYLQEQEALLQEQKGM